MLIILLVTIYHTLKLTKHYIDQNSGTVRAPLPIPTKATDVISVWKDDRLLISLYSEVLLRETTNRSIDFILVIRIAGTLIARRLITLVRITVL